MEDSPRYVMDAQTKRCYTESSFQTAFNESFLGHLAAVTRQATTPRKMARTISGLKKESHHKIVLQGALRLLRERAGEDVAEVHRMGGSVVATFAA